MSQLKIAAALEKQLYAVDNAMKTAWENMPFTPPANTIPYQQVNILFAKPVNEEWGSSYREQGYMQVTLKYPLSQGSQPAATRASLIRAAFPRKLTLAEGGVNTIIADTPEVSNGTVDGDRWSVIIRIPFYANIFTP